MTRTPGQTAPDVNARRSLVDALVPGATAIERRDDVPSDEAPGFQAELAQVAGAIAERRREYLTARQCAREALQTLGVAPGPLVHDGDRVPVWPAGCVGSLTHCRGYRAAIVASSTSLRSVGIDAEPHVGLDTEVRDLVLRPDERARLRGLARTHPGLRADTVTFCVKEAVYKAWFPLTRTWLDFEDVDTRVQPDGTFAARVRRAGLPQLRCRGRWVAADGLVVAAIGVPA